MKVKEKVCLLSWFVSVTALLDHVELTKRIWIEEMKKN